jgi:hypothetical protein
MLFRYLLLNPPSALAVGGFWCSRSDIRSGEGLPHRPSSLRVLTFGTLSSCQGAAAHLRLQSGATDQCSRGLLPVPNWFREVF